MSDNQTLRERVARAMQAIDDVVVSPVLPWDDPDADRLAYYRLADAAIEVTKAPLLALADEEDAYVKETQLAEICVAVPMSAGREVLDRIFEAIGEAVAAAGPARTDWAPFVSASMPMTPQVPVHLIRRALDGNR